MTTSTTKGGEMMLGIKELEKLLASVFEKKSKQQTLAQASEITTMPSEVQ